MDIGSAVVDPDDNRAAVGQIGHPNIARHWQRRVGGRDAFDIKDFPVRGIAAVEIVAVPRGQSFRTVVGIFLRVIGLAADNVGAACLVDTAALRGGLTLLDDPIAGRNAPARIDPARTGAICEGKTSERTCAKRRNPPPCTDTTPHRPRSPSKGYRILAWSHCGANRRPAVP